MANIPMYRFPEGIPPTGMSRAFVNNVRLRIQAQMRTKIRPEQRKGRLYKRALIRPLLPPVDGGKWNSKIFYVREEAKKINTAVTVLVDVSGSMGGAKLMHASMAACLLTNVLSRALRVPTEVLAFGFGGNCVTMSIVKDFKTVATTDEEIAGGILSSFNEGGGGNDDADALLFAYDRLIQRKEPNRIFIVLSDGCPSDSPNRASDPDSSLRYVCDEIRKAKKVTLHGIGIMHPNVKRYYGEHSSIIMKPEDLEHVLVETLSNKVFVDAH